MSNAPYSIRFNAEEKELAEAMVAERGLSSVSDLIRSLLRQEKQNDMLQQIYINTVYLQTAAKLELAKSPDRQAFVELWAKQKEKMGVMNNE